MKISTKGRYGLMLLVDLAQNDNGQPVALKTIAERQGLSEHYLEQLIAPLRNRGFVKSVRGAYGGYILAKSGSEITAADAILTLEGPLEIVDGEVDDGFHDLWDRLQESIRSVLSNVTLQDLVAMRERQQGSYMYYI
ncbi:RrF2 family transcriptional regulator [Alicyclobacillus mengziensis]|uniref:Rrf2 family transcriptional regulator n=1 Tax=Alicyclobacillus mengziensis TaxID=2931921 RepID=A0A9X7VWI0_9BACL|nr:Rrf2 family transcriptional regulator [Alicyclobacillus mengziensis]QSO46147.1 Rrf2 family transcriptional regulator [Alicyclobacillus mengziensis]